MKPHIIMAMKVAGEKVANIYKRLVEPALNKYREMKLYILSADRNGKFTQIIDAVLSMDIQKTMAFIKEKLTGYHAESMIKIISFLEELNDKVKTELKNLEEYPYMKEFKAEWENLTSKAIWAWKYLDIEGELRSIFSDISNSYERIVRIVTDNKSKILKMELGHIEFDIQLPFEITKSMKMISLESFLTRAQHVQDSLVSSLPKVRWTPLDYYYKPRHTTLPPFKAHGLIAGNQHFKTFDGKFFEFSGECSYVLARDFADGKFTVVVNYRKTKNGPRRHSISIMSNGKTIEIFQNSRVSINAAHVELPVHMDGMTVNRVENEIKVSNSQGLDVVCNMETELCLVSLSGWHFGKTGGLLGTYDYEPETDIINPRGQNLESIERFANSWEVAKHCLVKENKAVIAPQRMEQTTAHQICSSLFEDDSLVSGSPLRPAFRVVDPSPFMKMCVNDLHSVVVGRRERRGNEEERMTQKSCVAARAYVLEARLRGISIPTPSACLECKKCDGGSFVDDAVVSEKTVVVDANAADVVVVVEEGACNENKGPELVSLVEKIQTEMTRVNGMRDNNRFALTAFGGDDVHAAPHSHTMDGKVWNGADRFARGIRSLKFAVGGGEKKDGGVEEALEFAVNSRWRAGASRTIVL